VIFHGGFDSSVEELFYYGGAPATRRGYNCLTFDGPGQGSPIREQKLPFRYDWEKVVTPAVDYALTRPEVAGDKLALIGMSLGGYLAARAAAFEHRFQAAVFFDGVYDYHQSYMSLLPKDAVQALEVGENSRFEEIVNKLMQSSTVMRWAVTQGLWSFGVASLTEYMSAIKKMTMEGIAAQIKCPCLVMDAEGDLFFRGQPKEIFDALRVPKKLVKFTAEDGAENHCQSGALAFKDEVVFNWLDETLSLNEGRTI
jgi:pimeloyl-ACP methyl ester carboxylesterase